MESINTEDTVQETILLQIIREVCSTESQLSGNIKSKVNKIISECELMPYLSLHKFNAVDESTSNVLGIVQKCSTELTYSEQTELNQVILQTLQSKLPALNSQLEAICGSGLGRDKQGLLASDAGRRESKKALLESIDNKLNIVKEQEGEKVDIMMEWLHFKMEDAMNYASNTTDLLAGKTKMLELKSKILNLQILHSIFTETNNSVKAYTELQQDLQASIQEAERKIKEYKQIIHND